MQQRMKYLVVSIAALAILLLLANSLTVWKVTSQAEQLDPSEGDHKYDGVTILKPTDAADYLPNRITPVPPPKEAIPVTPGQPVVRDFRGSPENLAKITPEPTKRPEDAWLHAAILEVIPFDSKQQGLWSELVVVAQVIDVQARWSTSDGQRPANPHTYEDPHYIYTETTAKIEQVLIGDASRGDQLTLIQNGGRIGEDELVVNDGYEPFRTGQTVILFLNFGLNPEIQKVHYRVDERYIVDPSTQIAANPFFQKPLATIIAEMEEVKEMKEAIREGRFTPPPPPQK